MRPVVKFPKSNLPNFSSGGDPSLIWMRCKTPTKTMTQDGLYQGYIYTHHRGPWGEYTVTLFHFIDDRGVHNTCSLLRLSRSNDTYAAKRLKENEQINKDNPVPSLDINYIKQLREDVNSMKVRGDIDNLQTVEAVIILLDKLIQNGRETDKEQPKLECKLEKLNHHYLHHHFKKRIAIYENNKLVSVSEWSHPEGSMFHSYNKMEFFQCGYNGEIYWRNLG